MSDNLNDADKMLGEVREIGRVWMQIGQEHFRLAAARMFNSRGMSQAALDILLMPCPTPPITEKPDEPAA